MEFTKENMRFYIFMRCKLGESAKLIHETFQTVCGECACSYQTVCSWKSAINEQRSKISTYRTLLLHDNAGPHKARATSQSLRELGIQVLPHPAYSPDLAPCDFWLFPILKDRLAGRKFHRIQDLAKAVNSGLRTIPEEDYQGAFPKWQITLKETLHREPWRVF
ncbi:transposase [Elysia marginata]|uniref:Transposase n=1 Tax=Elysia marginata TaxID=1093978 RepID=A0AAV4FZP7_9GAST|nr:transposase [Elysia marginata]